jgi:hypothetical protein
VEKRAILQSFRLIAGMLAMTVAAQAQAACVPPAGFVDRPAPAVLPFDRLVSHSESVVIDRPMAAVLRIVQATSLKDAIDHRSNLPGVSGTHMLTPGDFDRPGARRLTCLTDGSTVEEQILVNRSGASAAIFQYVVWNYTTERARPIDYGVGRFVRTQFGDGHTHTQWTYGFALKRDRFPGWLGGFGEFLFRKFFLERDYATMMRNSLAGEKAHAEQK